MPQNKVPEKDSGKTIRDRIRNKVFRQQINITPIQDKVMEGHQSGLNVCHMPEEILTKTINETKVQ